jgi:hypothetical protein
MQDRGNAFPMRSTGLVLRHGFLVRYTRQQHYGIGEINVLFPSTQAY